MSSRPVLVELLEKHTLLAQRLPPLAPLLFGSALATRLPCSPYIWGSRFCFARTAHAVSFLQVPEGQTADTRVRPSAQNEVYRLQRKLGRGERKATRARRAS